MMFLAWLELEKDDTIFQERSWYYLAKKKKMNPVFGKKNHWYIH